MHLQNIYLYLYICVYFTKYITIFYYLEFNKRLFLEKERKKSVCFFFV